jgi:hypothetical protein
MKKIRAAFPDVEQVVLERTPHLECLKLKKTCHIIFDHMRGWFGISSLESLCQGKPVVAGLDEWNIRCIKEFSGADSLPWIVARDEQELQKVLTDLVGSRDIRQKTGADSRHFMETFWTEQKVLKVLLDVYLGL